MKDRGTCCIFILICIVLSLAPVAATQTVTHGPVTGAVTAHSARLLVRTDRAAEISFEISTDSTFAGAVSISSGATSMARDFFVVLTVEALDADTEYFYRVVVNQQFQAGINRFRTFPATGEAIPFTFAFGGCQQNPRDPESNIGRVFPLITREAPRFFLQLGDWTYPDTTDSEGAPDDFFNVNYERIQANYHSKYSPSYPMAELFRSVPVDYVYDDHDFVNNNADGTFPATENSRRGYQEMFPHYSLANSDNGIWHKFTFGNADFFMLDTRNQRAPNADAFSPDSAGMLTYGPSPQHLLLQADPTISGELQMDWLIRELQASTADWKFLCTSVPFNPGMRAIMELVLLVQGTEVENIIQSFGFESAAQGAILVADSWGGFPHSVQRLLRAVSQAGVQNVIALSGDSHTAGIDDGANSFFPEIMAGGLDRSNSRLVAAADLFGMNLWNAGGQTFTTGNFNSHFGRVSVFGADSVRLELIDEFGALIASHTVLSGHQAATTGLNHTARNRIFENTAVGDTARLDLVLINTGADTVRIAGFESSDPVFSVSEVVAEIAPGQSKRLQMQFHPQASGTVIGSLLVASNDPDSPLVLPLRGRGLQTTSVTGGPEPPHEFGLAQNFPNPFNGQTRLSFSLEQESDVQLLITNVVGQTVRSFALPKQPSGSTILTWDARDVSGRALASGVYFIRLLAMETTGRMQSATAKMLLMK